MANEFIIRKGYIALEDSQITGSLSVTNSVTASFFTGSYRGDGSQLTGIEGFPFTGSAGITGSLTVVGPVNATTFTGDGSQLTGIEGFPFTGSAKITGSLEVTGSVTATSFTGSIQGTATSASYVQLANIDGFTAYSASVNTAIDSVLDATTPLTATVNTTNSPFTVTSQSIVIIDSTNGDVTVNLPDLNAINGTPDQKPILLYKNDYSQNVIYVQPSGSQLVNGTTQDIIVSIQIAIAYNPTSAGWVTEGTSYQSLAELELFFVPRTETGSFATTGSNQFSGSQAITGSLTVTGNITGNITGSATTASYVEYTNVANKPALVSGSSQITYSGLTGIPSGILSGSAQIAAFGYATTGSNGFNGNQSITGSLTVSGQVVAQTLNVQQVTSSIVYSSGSNVFGNSLANTQQFTGSVGVTGSLTVNGTSAVVGSGTSGQVAYFNGTTSIASESNLFWDITNDRLGISTATPSYKLDIHSGSDFDIRLRDNSLGGTVGILFETANDFSGTSQAFIKGIGAGNSGRSQLIFGTATNVGDVTASEKLRLDSAGNLGLGVTPSAWSSGFTALQVKNASFWSTGNDASITSNAYYDGSNYRYIATSGASRIYHNTDGSIVWSQASSGTAGNAITFTQAMTLDASGRLGIGTTSPNANSRLHVYRGGGSYDTIVADGDAGTNTGYAIYEGGSPRYALYSNGAGGNDSFNIYNFGASSNSLTILTSGNVGIGTGTPSDLLTLYRNASQDNVLSIYQGTNGYAASFKLIGNNDDGARYNNIGSYTNGGTVHWLIGGGAVANTMVFYTNNNTERMRITSGGFSKHSNTGAYSAGGSSLHEFNTNQNDTNTAFFNTSATLSGARAGIDVLYTNASPNSTTAAFYEATDSTTLRFSVRSNGGIANFQANNVSLSDERTKKDISPLESYWDKFKALEIVKFKYKDQTHDDFNIGVIAQQVEQVAPEFVDVDGWNTRPKLDEGGNEIVSTEEPLKSIYTADLYHATIKVLQEAMVKIEEQQSQIEILKAEIQTLKQ